MPGRRMRASRSKALGYNGAIQGKGLQGRRDPVETAFDEVIPRAAAIGGRHARVMKPWCRHNGALRSHRLSATGNPGYVKYDIKING